MELPIVNRLSGTHPPDLLKDYTNAHMVVQRALDVLGGVWPHGRDYQGGSIRNAMHEHAERCKHLKQVLIELDIICQSIINQQEL